MFIRRVKRFRVCTEKNSLCNSLFFICTLCLFLYTSPCKAALPKDSIKKKYDLNDPRNPDCPCHKYQKLAEDEYKNKSKEISKNSKEEFSRGRKRNHGLWYGYRKFVFRFEKEHKKQKRIKVNYGICFKW
jgi:hypothetical protein